MREDLLDAIPALAPAEFFAFSYDAPYAKKIPASRLFRSSFLLPSTAELLDEDSFADVAFAWNEERIVIAVFSQKPIGQSAFPNYREGDSLELFFDTRDMKNAGFATRFCHHFVILPDAVQGIRAQEVTHFRSEDAHPLCDPEEIVVETEAGRSSYTLQVEIPAAALHGYDPSAFDRIGFTYRLNRYQGAPQHFSVSSAHCTIEQHPSTWASFTLKK